MIYKQAKEKYLTPELFANPSAEYRGAPFWAWNCKLEGEELTRQIDIFKQMGLGGFFMHSRSGLATEYMGEEFMQMTQLCNEKAIKNEMICYLYDEDRWPSGAAGGLVTKDISLRSQLLVFCPAQHNFGEGKPLPYRRNQVDTTAGVTLLARYKVKLLDGDLVGYERIENIPDVYENGVVYYEAFNAISGNHPWFNNQAYANTLDKKAIARFIELTHEKYKEKLGDYFGKSIPAIFTDEPQFSFKQNLTRGADMQAVTLPFTADFEETYTQAYGEGLLDFLPELFWEWQDKRPSKARYRYHDHVCERFTQAFSDQVGAWCEANGLMLTGHMMAEETLTSQTMAIGDCMRAFRSFQLPGIDMLCDRREYATAKQAQSAAHQYGREGVMSELYGVTNWDFDFRGHKLQGDWQAALGITLRVHHLTWVSMAGEAKRDYPASIGYQSPWFKEYSFIEDHFARVNTALTRGKPIVNVAVIHPVESLWMAFGPNDKTNEKRAELEAQYENVIDWLLFGQMDFDFISEALLPDLYKETTDKKFTVGCMAYDAVVVPGCISLRKTTRERLAKFAAHGGAVLYMGSAPTLADGEVCSGEFSGGRVIPFAKTALLGALENFREVDITRLDGIRTRQWIYQLRQDGDDRWLFICNGTKPVNQDLPSFEVYAITVNGLFTAEIYNTMDGTINKVPLSHHVKGGKTVIMSALNMHDSLLVKLSPIVEANAQYGASFGMAPVTSDIMPIEGERPLAPHAFTLSEPNVLLLDNAAYAFNGGAWQAEETGEDVLRIDNKFRMELGYPLRRNHKAQPWILGNQNETPHALSLRFTVQSEIELQEISLALENAEQTQIMWNGARVNAGCTGYYVDKSISTVPLPSLKIGENTLMLKIPFGKATDVENCFLLGQFGVRVQGRNSVIIPFPKALPFGDITQMGLPFYGGNITYHCHVNGGENTQLQATHFTNPLLTVDVNGKRAGTIAFAPYSVDLGALPAEESEVQITAYGNRVNTFGPIHNANVTEKWIGPDAWRTTGASWAYEYRVKPTGILVSPTVRILPA
ncbi:MAG: hypothetical protein FWC16_09285 [Defluviitaleaceae bacterium]|nr:hypothetical protein [Defluviitaleaceae bacterium]MCL2275104.1 hypothetical protein [Defluviitaleaceae bacterium]